MKSKKLLLGMLAIALVLGMTVVGCGEDSNGGGGTDYSPDPNNPFKGVWEGSGFTVSCTANTWKAVYPSQGGSWSGTYTVNNGTANFTDNSGTWGTATISGTRMTVYNNNIGQIILTRKN